MKYFLAPLAGFTDAPFRRLCFEGGVDLAYTEMVSAAGLAHGSSPTCHLMETMTGEGSVALQLFGAKESDIAVATEFIEKNIFSRKGHPFVELNLNAGCPMTKVTREGAGAKLVEDPAKIARLLTVMRERTHLPVTLKTRLGPNPQQTNIFEILDAAQGAGAKGIIVHARYTSQMHGGATHLDTLAELVRRSEIPVVGNGSVTDHLTAAAMAQTGVEAIMVGRAALAKPTIFNTLKKVSREEESSSAMLRRHLKYLIDFHRQLKENFPNDHLPSIDGFTSVKMHVHLFRYFNGRPGAAELRRRLNAVRTLAEIRTLVDAFDN